MDGEDEADGRRGGPRQAAPARESVGERRHQSVQHDVQEMPAGGALQAEEAIVQDQPENERRPPVVAHRFLARPLERPDVRRHRGPEVA